jgi:hypothetical protein
MEANSHDVVEVLGQNTPAQHEENQEITQDSLCISRTLNCALPNVSLNCYTDTKLWVYESLTIHYSQCGSLILVNGTDQRWRSQARPLHYAFVSCTQICMHMNSKGVKKCAGRPVARVLFETKSNT